MQRSCLKEQSVVLSILNVYTVLGLQMENKVAGTKPHTIPSNQQCFTKGREGCTLTGCGAQISTTFHLDCGLHI